MCAFIFCYFCTKINLEIINYDEEKGLMFLKNYARIEIDIEKAWMVQAKELLPEVLSHRELYFFQREGITG